VETRCTTADHRLLVLGENPDLGLVATIDVATRVVHEKVKHTFDTH